MKDELLQLLVQFPESENYPLGITLVVDGFLVSGIMVSKKEYFESHPITAKMLELYESEEEANSLEAEATLGAEEESFIHLKNAYYFTPGQKPLPTNEGVFCRFRIDSISGFNFGVLKIE